MLRKDKIPLTDYYKAWDKVDIDEDMEAADEEKPKNTNVVKETFDENLGKQKEKNIGINIVTGNRKPASNAEILKQEGNEMVRQREFLKAIDLYSNSINSIESDNENFDDQTELYVSVLTNRAHCWLQLQEYTKGLKDCQKAISLKSDHAKAYFRKGLLLKRMEDWRGANQAFLEGLEYAPEDPSFTREIDFLTQKINETKALILESMRVKLIPDNQIFVKIDVVDDNEAEIEEKPARKSASSASTASNLTVPANNSSTNLQDASRITNEKQFNCASDFIHLKNIDGEQLKKTKNVIEEEQNDESPDKKSSKRVRFNPKVEELKKPKPRRSKFVDITKLKSSLRDSVSNKLPQTEAKPKRAKPSTTPQESLSISPQLSSLRKKIESVSSATQFEEVCRNCKQDRASRAWLLKELGTKRFEQVFAKGMEFTTFSQLLKSILNDFDEDDQDCQLEYIQTLPKIKDFGFLLKMLTKKERAGLTDSLRQLNTVGVVPADLLPQLINVYN